MRAWILGGLVGLIKSKKRNREDFRIYFGAGTKRTKDLWQLFLHNSQEQWVILGRSEPQCPPLSLDMEQRKGYTVESRNKRGRQFYCISRQFYCLPFFYLRWTKKQVFLLWQLWINLKLANCILYIWQYETQEYQNDPKKVRKNCPSLLIVYLCSS